MRKNWCSFSFAKLMQSCSNELTSKISKPKTSSSPMNAIASVAAPRIDSLTFATTQSKSRQYTAFASALRAATACAGVSWML